VSLPEPTDVIAPREGVPYTPCDFLSQMLEGAYPSGVVLEYHSFKLYSHVDEDHRHNIWAVHTEEGCLIETLNLDAFRTATEIEQLLEEIVLYDPSDRTEWVNSR
jgi:hypothetical protein